MVSIFTSQSQQVRGKSGIQIWDVQVLYKIS